MTRLRRSNSRVEFRGKANLSVGGNDPGLKAKPGARARACRNEDILAAVFGVKKEIPVIPFHSLGAMLKKSRKFLLFTEMRSKRSGQSTIV